MFNTMHVELWNKFDLFLTIEMNSNSVAFYFDANLPLKCSLRLTFCYLQSVCFKIKLAVLNSIKE